MNDDKQSGDEMIEMAETLTRAQAAQGRPRGFAAMDRKIVSEIARKGGKAAHEHGTAHEFTSDEAKAAGQKGGRRTAAAKAAKRAAGGSASDARAKEAT